ncbi:neurofilament light polypeptide-like [Balamuthia mandrillaris]
MLLQGQTADQEEVRQQLYQREELMTAQQFKAFVEGHFRLDTYGPNFCRSCRRGNRNRRVQRNNIQRTLNAMYAYYKALMHPKGPLCVQPTADGRGLGLFLRDRRQWERHHSEEEKRRLLCGVLFEITQVPAAERLAGQHSLSLYHMQHRTFVLCGALSLVNHACDAPLTFGNPVRASTEQQKVFFARWCLYVERVRSEREGETEDEKEEGETEDEKEEGETEDEKEEGQTEEEYETEEEEEENENEGETEEEMEEEVMEEVMEAEEEEEDSMGAAGNDVPMEEDILLQYPEELRQTQFHFSCRCRQCVAQASQSG